ncbi:hypothetical protein SAY87_021163 [Trapa incisa]|uniref:Nodulin-like domain-containing protein n=1 Tax=Trapa incisa TaxID=236973 RepID=A0AAN7JSN3_9MYRT|nr:hypothetical protein SAY87_021163 [Trapa incisa]
MEEVGQSRKWMVLVATTWLQAFTGTNFDFSSYSSELKSQLGISQLQLNYLSVASDLGKAFGWCSGVFLLYFPLWAVMFMAAFFGLFGYGLQWLLIQRLISLPYFLVFLLCLLAGCSICWFNTVCFVLCIRNFPSNRALALSLTISFNGLTAAIYTLVANAINYDDDTLYLLLNALVPLFTSGVALIPVLRQPQPPPSQNHPHPETTRRDSRIFLCLNMIAVATGLYILLLNPLSNLLSRARILLAGAIFLLASPMVLPGTVYAREWTFRLIASARLGLSLNGSSFNLVDPDNLQLQKELLGGEPRTDLDHLLLLPVGDGDVQGAGFMCRETCCPIMEKDLLTVLGEEHPAGVLVRRLDFWLYYLAYFCGGTIGLVYSNNLGQISQSLGFSGKTSGMVTLYSSCSFFGRLLSAAPDYLRDKVYFARTGWLALALVPTPMAFYLLSASSSLSALRACTALIGLSSGFVFSAAVSITSELFGPNSVGVNHNILITNIPLGSVLYGLLAALVYDTNAGEDAHATVCMGKSCYFITFMAWACISTVGLICSMLLFLRTKPVYDRFERNRVMAESP